MCHSLCGYRTQSTTIQISDKTFSVKTENRIKNISLTIKKKRGGREKEEKKPHGTQLTY